MTPTPDDLVELGARAYYESAMKAAYAFAEKMGNAVPEDWPHWENESEGFRTRQRSHIRAVLDAVLPRVREEERERAGVITMTEKEYAKFQAVLDAPPQPSEKLVELMRRGRELIGKADADLAAAIRARKG